MTFIPGALGKGCAYFDRAAAEKDFQQVCYIPASSFKDGDVVLKDSRNGFDHEPGAYTASDINVMAGKVVDDTFPGIGARDRAAMARELRLAFARDALKFDGAEPLDILLDLVTELQEREYESTAGAHTGHAGRIDYLLDLARSCGFEADELNGELLLSMHYPELDFKAECSVPAGSSDDELLRDLDREIANFESVDTYEIMDAGDSVTDEDLAEVGRIDGDFKDRLRMFKGKVSGRKASASASRTARAMFLSVDEALTGAQQEAVRKAFDEAVATTLSYASSALPEGYSLTRLSFGNPLFLSIGSERKNLDRYDPDRFGPFIFDLKADVTIDSFSGTAGSSEGKVSFKVDQVKPGSGDRTGKAVAEVSVRLSELAGTAKPVFQLGQDFPAKVEGAVRLAFRGRAAKASAGRTARASSEYDEAYGRLDAEIKDRLSEEGGKIVAGGVPFVVESRPVTGWYGPALSVELYAEGYDGGRKASLSGIAAEGGLSAELYGLEGSGRLGIEAVYTHPSAYAEDPGELAEAVLDHLGRMAGRLAASAKKAGKK